MAHEDRLLQEITRLRELAARLYDAGVAQEDVVTLVAAEARATVAALVRERATGELDAAA